MAEILNSFVYHLLQKSFYQKNNSNKFISSLFTKFLSDVFAVLVASISLLRFDTVLSKIVFDTKFARANLALKTSATNLLKSEVKI